jgi:hypothetical protein
VWHSLAPSFLEEGPIDSNKLGKRHLGGDRSLENKNNVVNNPVMNFPLEVSSNYRMKVIFSCLLFS